MSSRSERLATGLLPTAHLLADGGRLLRCQPARQPCPGAMESLVKKLAEYPSNADFLDKVAAFVR